MADPLASATSAAAHGVTAGDAGVVRDAVVVRIAEANIPDCPLRFG